MKEKKIRKQKREFRNLTYKLSEASGFYKAVRMVKKQYDK